MNDQYEGIAIISMAGRFPGADSVEEFWENLVAGKETVSFFTDAELLESGLDPEALRRRGKYVAARGFLKDADCFDAAFFGVHPKEAEVIDPQQRVFLETCWTAIERAGYAPNQLEGSVGVFGGVTFNTYQQQVLQKRPDLMELIGSDLVMFGNERDYLTTRVAYKLGLKGPALNVSTACSTSLVAVCQACQSLLTYQCDMAVAGGASVTVPQKRGYYHDEGNIGSADGHTRSFDVQASGTVFGNGVGVVVLKRLEDAVNDGDQIYAVIKGAGLNNDGSQRVSFGAPGVDGQSKVVALAQALAGVDPETISYVEAHGTATPLGDPIEVAGLTKAFRAGTDAKQFCALGSVKTNIGHLDAAAGVTGLIKTALSLHNKQIPASLHFTAPNPKLDLENSPFYVNDKLQPWQTKPGVPRRAGVSSFGTGGTNAHMVVEEAPVVDPSGSSRPFQLLVMSAKTNEALDKMTANLSSHLERLSRQSASEQERALADTAFTLQTGRSEFVHRRALVCRDAAEGAALLAGNETKRIITHYSQLKEAPVVFMFPGQGAQYGGMGAELYRNEPVFCMEVDRCAELLKPLLNADIRTVMFTAAEADALVQTRFTQPALFVIEYALAKLWLSWGITPAAMIGHSVGEYVAGCLAGVFSLEDALMLVAHRAALVQAQPGGAMLAIRRPEQDVLPLLNSDLAIAAVNSPNLCVVSGPFEAVDALEKELESRRIAFKRLQTSHAFHSPMMEPVLEPFAKHLKKVHFNAPCIPYVSNVSAGWITNAQATSPEYWRGHVRQTVRFADGIAELMKDARYVLLEVGPGQTLTQLARQHPAKPNEQIVVPSLPLDGDQEVRGLLESLGRLWMAGATIDWKAFYANERRRRLVVPTYPFERKRYWPEPFMNSEPNSAVAPKIHAAAGAGVGSGNYVAAASANHAVLPQSHAVSEQPKVSSIGTPEATIPRCERLLAATRSLMQDLSGYDLSEVDSKSDLLELGLDSLLLTQAAQLLQQKFGVQITFRQLMEELSSLDAIVSYIDNKLPPEAFAPAPAALPVAASAPAAGDSQVPGSVLEQLLQQQQQLTNQLLQLMGRQPNAVPLPAASMPKPAPPVMSAPSSNSSKEPQKSHGPFKPIDRAMGMALSEKQNAALDALIARYIRKTPESKKLATQSRPLLADPRSVSGFKQLWKEIVYPIFTNRSDGSRVWDVDGNEYIDFVMGFGASMFGHRPPFVVNAVHEQLDIGFEIGPIQPLATEVAALVREFTGMKRCAFTNTGSEAVLAATRISRTVTGRSKIAVFAGAYHGIFDEVLFRPLTINGETRTAPIAPGIPQSSLDQVIVLDYGNPQSLDILRARGSEIAAVLVEPVQSRRLDLQPKEFMHELRKVTQEIGSALIFDEVVTGFRVHPGGAQAYFGVKADLATYGKVIGGGISIGVVAGDPKFMDALDGGQWQYGDKSFPEVGVTFFAGTFVRHPLALAAAKAVLQHLKRSGPSLQITLAERTSRLADELRTIVQEFNAPYIVTQFSSLIQVGFPADQKFASLLFYMLRERGIHIYENRAFVMTTAHTEDDLSRLKKAWRESLREMQAGEFYSPTGGGNKPISAPGPAPSGKVAQVSALTQQSDTGAFPLTEPQKEIWLAAQMGGEAAVAYNESLKLEFRGHFNEKLFRAAIDQVIERHPILLASITNDGQMQRIPASRNLSVPSFDLSEKNDAERDRELETLIEREVSEAFDLAHGPLVRVRIVQLASDHFIVLWTAHHIVCDGWSGGLLVSELAKIYSALKTGSQPALDSPGSFHQYALDSQVRSSESLDALGYWCQQFAEIPLPLDLPTDHPYPRVRTARAATLKRDLDAVLHQALKRAAGQQRTTLVVLLMAALKTLLCRLSGQTDLVVGFSVAGQAVTGNNNLVGHCVNLLPLRTHLDHEATFQDNLSLVKKNVLDAYDHHQATLGSILQNLKVPRNTGRPPLVEVIFNVDKDPGSAEFAGVEFSCERNPKRALHFELFFNFVEGPRGLYIECDYNTELFDPSTIERWLEHYQTLLESITANPKEKLSLLPILTEQARKMLTVGWNATGVDFPPQDTLTQWFERQVERAPDACALIFEGTRLTYDQLNRRANKIAHYLRKAGVASDVLVGLFMERSVEMVVGILGILKAGGAYLPMDPVYPKDRLAFMLEDAKVPILLTQTKLVSMLPDHEASVMCLDANSELWDREPDHNPAGISTPNNLAYVIYTSGSTGKPKGSLITHHNVVRLMRATEHWYHFNQDDIWTFFHSHAFDFSVWELWGALLYGGRVVVVPYLISRSPEEFYMLLVNEGVTVLNQTPSAFQQLMQAEESLGTSDKLNLRYVIFGGEALELYRLKPWFERHGDQRPQLVNMYGITETTVHVTYRPLSAKDVGSGSIIGVPIPDLQIYLLDPCRQPVPIGVAGEIYVGGAGVAKGYLNREELSRERFIPDPFSNRPDAILYRSGDMGKYLPNRDIEYLGRIDQQVKIRGFRIELGEIEAVLARHTAVKQCVVIARQDRGGDKLIVAYLEPRTGLSLDVSDLRAHLKKDLPDYMVPAAFISMDSLPLTANGKINLRALPAPEQGRIEFKGKFIAPRDFVEQMLAQIWARVLKVKRVGLHDNFFELGGHSILAVRIIVEIEKLFKKRLPLATLLQAPTIAELSEVLRKENWKPSWNALVPIQPGGSKPPLFLVHSHGGNVLEYYPLASHLGEDQPVYALQARGLDGNIIADQSLEEMATIYIEELRSLQPTGPYFLGGFCFGGLLALEAAQQLIAAGEAVALVAMIQTTHPDSSQALSKTMFLRRWWRKGVKRFDLEWENMGHQGKGYLIERFRRSWDILRARTEIKFDRILGRDEVKPAKMSMPRVLELLGAKHDKAFDRYHARPYAGNVVLFRATKQLPELAGDAYLGWKTVLPNMLVCEVIGHQQNILGEPKVKRLAQELAVYLHAAQLESGVVDEPDLTTV
jgi:amino acid adenylation domain-containing protein